MSKGGKKKKEQGERDEIKKIKDIYLKVMMQPLKHLVCTYTTRKRESTLYSLGWCLDHFQPADFPTRGTSFHFTSFCRTRIDITRIVISPLLVSYSCHVSTMIYVLKSCHLSMRTESVRLKHQGQL